MYPLEVDYSIHYAMLTLLSIGSFNSRNCSLRGFGDNFEKKAPFVDITHIYIVQCGLPC